MRHIKIILAVVICLTSVLASSAFAGWECFLASPARLCVINVDQTEDFFSVNRPDQEICGINLISTASRYSYEGWLTIKNEFRLRSRNVDTGNEILIRPEDKFGAILSFPTGGVFGYANNYHFKSPTTETLNKYFKRVLELNDSDKIFAQVYMCPDLENSNLTKEKSK